MSRPSLTSKLSWIVLAGGGLLWGPNPQLVAADANLVVSAPVHRVFAAGQLPPDARLAPARTLRDEYHPWSPPATLNEWDVARERIRTQLLVACGLWPLPDNTPLEPVIHGRVDRDDYTVERVYFASRPGLYVTGSLYRPKGFEGRRPGVLCPHGHWANGRFYDAGEAEAARQIAAGAESRPSAARFPLQARMVQLARMGCVVFHYDMIGYADQGPLDHRSGFSDAQAELWSQNILGLQTWNSIRALDFLASLPDVDPKRIGVTGASGGGTQTFVLGAIDPRPATAFPAVMVSTNMQGGCVCENASYLRIGLNNIAFAACFAPRPLGMTGANDWTIDIETKGLPELKQVWNLYGASEEVDARCFPQFGHNYNEVSRKVMYGWFNRHLGLGVSEPIEERDFTPLSREELTVFTAEHPRPSDALPAAPLRERLTEETRAWYAGLVERARANPREYREIVGPAAEAIFGPLPRPTDLTGEVASEGTAGDVRITRGWCSRAGDAAAVPWVMLWPEGTPQGLAVWIDGRGKHALFERSGAPIPPLRDLLKRGHVVVTADVFLTGEYLPTELDVTRPVNRGFAGYTFGYNRPLLVERVRDILTVAAFAERTSRANVVHWTGTREAGPWVLLARGLRGPEQSTTVADVGGFAFAELTNLRDPNFLPGALKFGGLGGVLALAAPTRVELHGLAPAVEAELRPFVALGGEAAAGKQRLIPVRED